MYSSILPDALTLSSYPSALPLDLVLILAHPTFRALGTTQDDLLFFTPIASF